MQVIPASEIFESIFKALAGGLFLSFLAVFWIGVALLPIAIVIWLFKRRCIEFD